MAKNSLNTVQQMPTKNFARVPTNAANLFGALAPVYRSLGTRFYPKFRTTIPMPQNQFMNANYIGDNYLVGVISAFKTRTYNSLYDNFPALTPQFFPNPELFQDCVSGNTVGVDAYSVSLIEAIGVITIQNGPTEFRYFTDYSLLPDNPTVLGINLGASQMNQAAPGAVPPVAIPFQFNLALFVNMCQEISKINGITGFRQPNLKLSEGRPWTLLDYWNDMPSQTMGMNTMPEINSWFQRDTNYNDDDITLATLANGQVASRFALYYDSPMFTGDENYNPALRNTLALLYDETLFLRANLPQAGQYNVRKVEWIDLGNKLVCGCDGFPDLANENPVLRIISQEHLPPACPAGVYALMQRHAFKFRFYVYFETVNFNYTDQTRIAVFNKLIGLG
jgi:hypothetical protein